MASLAQIAANQRNAQFSTGPRTAAGKQVSSQNALKHGLTASTDAVMIGEDSGQYQELREGLWDDFRPYGAIEETLVDRVVVLTWRLARAARIDRDLMDLGVIELGQRGRGMLGFAVVNVPKLMSTLERIGKYERGIEASLLRCLHELQRLQATRLGGSAPKAVDVTVARAR